MPGLVSRASKLGTWPTWRPGYSQSPQPYSHDSPGFLHPPTHCERFVLQVHDMDVCFRRSTVEVKRPRLNGDSHGDTADRDGSFACPVLSISVPIVDVTLNTLLSVRGRPVQPISSEGIKGIKGIGEWNIRYLLANHGAKNVSEVERLSQQIRCLDLHHVGVLFVTCVPHTKLLALRAELSWLRDETFRKFPCPNFSWRLFQDFLVTFDTLHRFGITPKGIPLSYCVNSFAWIIYIFFLCLDSKDNYILSMNDIIYTLYTLYIDIYTECQSNFLAKLVMNWWMVCLSGNAASALDVPSGLKRNAPMSEPSPTNENQMSEPQNNSRHAVDFHSFNPFFWKSFWILQLIFCCSAFLILFALQQFIHGSSFTDGED